MSPVRVKDCQVWATKCTRGKMASYNRNSQLNGCGQQTVDLHASTAAQMCSDQCRLHISWLPSITRKRPEWVSNRLYHRMSDFTLVGNQQPCDFLGAIRQGTFNVPSEQEGTNAPISYAVERVPPTKDPHRKQLRSPSISLP